MERANDRGAPIYLGADTHSEAHVAAALDGAGRRMGELAVPNSEEAMRCLKRYIARETYRAILLDSGARVPLR